jgi:hypothetical protein
MPDGLKYEDHFDQITWFTFPYPVQLKFFIFTE